MIEAYYKSNDKNFTLLHGDCIQLLNSFDFKFDMIFADPPYHLSNGGISIQSGKIVSVNKGDWDKSNGFEADYQFDNCPEGFKISKSRISNRISISKYIDLYNSNNQRRNHEEIENLNRPIIRVLSQ